MQKVLWELFVPLLMVVIEGLRRWINYDPEKDTKRA